MNKPFAPSAERNSQSILEVLREEFRDAGSVLEIGSGTGQHAVAFGAGLGHLTWQTSDLPECHEGIAAWLDAAAPANVRKPLALDVLTADPPPARYDGVFSANTAHIMSVAAVEKMFALIAAVLLPGGVFCLYGPFRLNGTFNAASNVEFHRSLRARDADMGIRHLEDLDCFGVAAHLQRRRLYAMPANNYLVVWIKSLPGAADDHA